MNIKYSMILLKSLQHPSESFVYYPQAQIMERINFYGIVCEISNFLSLLKEGILHILQTQNVKIKDHLADIDKVSFREFGNFQYQIQGKRSLTLNEFNDRSGMHRVKFQSKPGRYRKESMKNIDYEYLIPVKIKEKIKREEKEKLKQAIFQEHP